MCRPLREGDGTSTHRSEEHTSELQSPCNFVCRLLLEKSVLCFCVLWFCVLRLCLHEGSGLRLGEDPGDADRGPVGAVLYIVAQHRGLVLNGQRADSDQRGLPGLHDQRVIHVRSPPAYGPLAPFLIRTVPRIAQLRRPGAARPPRRGAAGRQCRKTKPGTPARLAPPATPGNQPPRPSAMTSRPQETLIVRSIDSIELVLYCPC